MASFQEITSYGDGAYKVIIVAALLTFMQIFMVGARFVSRKLRKTSYAADDYVLLIAAILTIGLCALALAFPRVAGVGASDAITRAEDLSDDKTLGQSFMAWLILYGLCIAFAKCAILLLYVRVFTTSNKAFTASVYLVGSVVIAAGLANIFVAIFQCSPVAYEWDKSIPGGKCIDQIAFERYMTIPNVVTGAIMLVMPLPLSWKLNLSISARIALTATLLHGIIGFVASCARLSIFFRTSASFYSNETSLIWTIWTINEPANYIIAASLPTLRPIFLHVFPSSFFMLTNRTSSRRSNGTRKIWKSPSSSAMLSPLEGGGAENGRQHFRWTTTEMTGPYGSRCEESWVDVEAASRAGSSVRVASRSSYNNNNHNSYNDSYNSNQNNYHYTDYNNNDYIHELRLAAMHAPGSNIGTDEVVPETMVEVTAPAAGAKKNGFF